MEITKTDYVVKVINYYQHSATHGWRAGQRLFNALHALKPDISEKIRGTENDPFHDDSKIVSFLNKVDELWNNGENWLATWWTNPNERRLR